MCGIIGYVGDAEALPILVEGIRLLSYRGYDSAGVAVQRPEGIRVAKDEGRIEDLAPRWDRHALAATVGIGHTRWATHGRPSRVNAHPQTDAAGAIAVVHNGVLENDIALREELERDPRVRFESETDTEIVAHLVGTTCPDDLLAAGREILRRCEGRFALAILSRSRPGEILAVRRGSPLVVGLGRGETLLASDVRAIAGRADRVVELHEDEIALLSRDGVRLHRADGARVERAPVPLVYDEATLGKGPFAHWMLKEIHEQPERLQDLVSARFDPVHRRTRLDELRLGDAELRRIERVDLVACGTASIAARYGARAIEALAGIPARMIPGSEVDAGTAFGPTTLVVAVSQSGETADVLGALDVAEKASAPTVGLVNVRSSRIAKSVRGFVDLHAGPEVSVASTKAYTAMLLSLLALAARLAEARGRGTAVVDRLLPALRELPGQVRACIDRASQVWPIAREVHRVEHMLYLGRGPDHATALEGALKMKELSYIHAEGYAAGEMKHGPIALISADVPSVAIVGYGESRTRMLGGIRELRARDGFVVAIAPESDGDIAKVADRVIQVPTTDPWVAPILHVVPLQLLAYEVARRLGRDVDQPRNLAKSVTVQ